VTTVYTLTGTSGNGCLKEDTMTVVVNPFPNVDAGADAAICLGESVTLTVTTSGTTCTWMPGSLSGNSVTVSPVVTTTYTVTCTDVNGCSHSDGVTVTVDPLPVVSAGSDVTINQGEDTQLNATGALSYSWSPATGLDDPNIANPTASPDSSICYTVTGTDANGCSDTDDVCVTVITGVDDPFVISWSLFPNPSDGKLVVTGTAQCDHATIEVRNVLGELVTLTRTVQGGTFSVEFDLTGKSSGWYVVIVSADGQISQRALVIE
jgi:hypothetical protein